MPSTTWSLSRNQSACLLSNLLLLLGGQQAELLSEQVGEQVVVAQAAVGTIERHDEHRAMPEQIELLPGAGSGRHRVAQWGAEPGQHRRRHQELTGRRLLLVEHLRCQVLHQQAIGAGDLLERRPRVDGPLERDRDELQARRPAVGPLDEHRAQIVLDGLPADRSDECQGAVRVEVEVVATQLDEGSSQSKLRHGQRQIPA